MASDEPGALMLEGPPAASALSGMPYEEWPELLTPDELRHILRVSRNTTYELLRRGEIPHLRFGRQIRIPKTALRQMTLQR